MPIAVPVALLFVMSLVPLALYFATTEIIKEEEAVKSKPPPPPSNLNKPAVGAAARVHKPYHPALERNCVVQRFQTGFRGLV